MRVGARVVVVLGLLVVSRVTRAQEALVPTRSDAQVQRGAAIARELERSIDTLPSVSEARVHVTLPTTPAYAGELGEPPRASVLVHVAKAATPSLRDAIQRLVAGSVPGLNPSDVTVVDSQIPARSAAPSTQWVRVGPFDVSPGSAVPLRYTLIGLLVAQSVLAALLVLLAKRVRRARRM